MAEVLTADEVALYLRTSPGTVKRMAKAGRLPAVKVGRTWRFRKADLDEMFTESMADEALAAEAERVLWDPDTEWVPWEKAKAERGL